MLQSMRLWQIFFAICMASFIRGHIQQNHVQNDDWDFLIFTQHWPVTVCQEWVDSNKKHECSFPNPEQSWTIHGIWPTKLGTEGPMFCNRSWHFDIEQVKPIEPALNQLWLNIEKGLSTYSLWAHEWTKHGTCAAVLPALGSEFHYFGQGLRWQRQYSMNIILAASNIYPHATKQYSVQDFHEAIKNQLEVVPIIECHQEHGLNYIFELRLCFSKKLELVDCTKAVSEKYSQNEILTNCPKNKGILYPATMPTFKQSPRQNFLVEMYKLISWLKWITL